LRDEERGVAGAFGARAADSVLQWPANRRSELQRRNPGGEIGKLAVELLLQAGADDLALRKT
jgi:hypothetical protein